MSHLLPNHVHIAYIERIYHPTRMWYDDMLMIIKSPPPSLVLTNYYYTYYSILCKSDILSALLLILTPGNHAVVIYQESKCKTTLIFFAPYLLEYVLMYKYRIHLLILLCKMWLVPLPNISNNDGRDIRVKNWEEKWIIEGSKYPLGLIWFGQLLLESDPRKKEYSYLCIRLISSPFSCQKNLASFLHTAY